MSSPVSSASSVITGSLSTPSLPRAAAASAAKTRPGLALEPRRAVATRPKIGFAEHLGSILKDAGGRALGAEPPWLKAQRHSHERELEHEDERGGGGPRHHAPREPGDPLDPLARVCAGLPFATSTPVPDGSEKGRESIAAGARISLEQVVGHLVRRIGWSGDSRSGVARIELGSGELSGATLVVHAEGKQVKVALELPPGIDGASWRERIRERLQARGIEVAEVAVT